MIPFEWKLEPDEYFSFDILVTYYFMRSSISNHKVPNFMWQMNSLGTSCFSFRLLIIYITATKICTASSTIIYIMFMRRSHILNRLFSTSWRGREPSNFQLLIPIDYNHEVSIRLRCIAATKICTASATIMYYNVHQKQQFDRLKPMMSHLLLLSLTSLTWPPRLLLAHHHPP